MIRSLQEKDIHSVARIHRDELPGFLSTLGEEFLLEFYRTSMKLPFLFTYVDDEKGIITGFVSGVESVKGLNKQIVRANLFTFLLISLKVAIRNPLLIVKVMRVLAYPGFTHTDGELLSIAIDRKYQRKNIGKRLFREVTTEFRKRNIHTFLVSIYSDLPANGFYRKIGCKMDSSFAFMGKTMNYYRFTIKQ